MLHHFPKQSQMFIGKVKSVFCAVNKSFEIVITNPLSVRGSCVVVERTSETAILAIDEFLKQEVYLSF